MFQYVFNTVVEIFSLTDLQKPTLLLFFLSTQHKHNDVSINLNLCIYNIHCFDSSIFPIYIIFDLVRIMEFSCNSLWFTPFNILTFLMYFNWLFVTLIYQKVTHFDWEFPSPFWLLCQMNTSNYTMKLTFYFLHLCLHICLDLNVVTLFNTTSYITKSRSIFQNCIFSFKINRFWKIEGTILDRHCMCIHFMKIFHLNTYVSYTGSWLLYNNINYITRPENRFNTKHWIDSAIV